MTKKTVVLPRSSPRDQAICRIVDMLEDLPIDQGYRVEVHEHKGTRSEQQNRMLWGLIYPEILRQGGEALGGWLDTDLHEYLLGEWSGWETITGFGRKRIRPVRRSSRLSKFEFSQYIDFIHQKMAGFGIVVPDALNRESEAA